MAARLPPDLSLITKARSYERGFPQFIFDFFTQFQEQGPNYVAAILQGFEDKPPAGVTIPDGSYYNKYFPGHAIKMPKPLSDGQVTFDDGSPATVAQYAKDVTTFLMWAAEPHMEARKRLGLAGLRVPDHLRRPDVLHQEEGLGRRALTSAPMTRIEKAPAGAFLLVQPGRACGCRAAPVPVRCSRIASATCTADKMAANRPPSRKSPEEPMGTSISSSVRTARTPTAISPMPRAATRRAWS